MESSALDFSSGGPETLWRMVRHLESVASPVGVLAVDAAFSRPLAYASAVERFNIAAAALRGTQWTAEVVEATHRVVEGTSQSSASDPRVVAIAAAWARVQDLSSSLLLTMLGGGRTLFRFARQTPAFGKSMVEIAEDLLACVPPVIPREVQRRVFPPLEGLRMALRGGGRGPVPASSRKGGTAWGKHPKDVKMPLSHELYLDEERALVREATGVDLRDSAGGLIGAHTTMSMVHSLDASIHGGSGSDAWDPSHKHITSHSFPPSPHSPLLSRTSTLGGESMGAHSTDTSWVGDHKRARDLAGQRIGWRAGMLPPTASVLIQRETWQERLSHRSRASMAPHAREAFSAFTSSMSTKGDARDEYDGVAAISTLRSRWSDPHKIGTLGLSHGTESTTPYSSSHIPLKLRKEKHWRDHSTRALSAISPKHPTSHRPSPQSHLLLPPSSSSSSSSSPIAWTEEDHSIPTLSAPPPHLTPPPPPPPPPRSPLSPTKALQKLDMAKQQEHHQEEARRGEAGGGEDGEVEEGREKGEEEVDERREEGEGEGDEEGEEQEGELWSREVVEEVGRVLRNGCEDVRDGAGAEARMEVVRSVVEWVKAAAGATVVPLPDPCEITSIPIRLVVIPEPPAHGSVSTPRVWRSGEESEDLLEQLHASLATLHKYGAFRVCEMEDEEEDVQWPLRVVNTKTDAMIEIEPLRDDTLWSRLVLLRSVLTRVPMGSTYLSSIFLRWAGTTLETLEAREIEAVLGIVAVALQQLHLVEDYVCSSKSLSDHAIGKLFFDVIRILRNGARVWSQSFSLRAGGFVKRPSASRGLRLSLLNPIDPAKPDLALAINPTRLRQFATAMERAYVVYWEMGKVLCHQDGSSEAESLLHRLHLTSK